MQEDCHRPVRSRISAQFFLFGGGIHYVEKWTVDE